MKTGLTAERVLEKGARGSLELLDSLICLGLCPAQNVRRAAECASAASSEDWEKLGRQVQRHGIGGIVWAGLDAVKRQAPQAVPQNVLCRMADVREAILYQYFSILSFTTYALELVRREHLRVYVLKGLTLSALYPAEGMRAMSDVDLYVPDPEEFRRACAALERDGFEPQQGSWDYHKGYEKELGGRRMTLELHLRPAGHMAARPEGEMPAMALFAEALDSADLYECAGEALPGLPADLYALHLLLHMMNHFIAGEFRLSMLCDWVVFWRAKSGDVRPERFRAMLRACGLEGFARLVTAVCVCHLGLEEGLVPETGAGVDTKKAQALYHRFFAKPLQSAPQTRVNAVLMPGLPTPVALGLEVHRQMRYRFPRARKCAVLWPVLWGATIAAFLHNNRVLGRGSVRQIIAEAGGKKRILEELALTEKGSG